MGTKENEVDKLKRAVCGEVVVSAKRHKPLMTFNPIAVHVFTSSPLPRFKRQPGVKCVRYWTQIDFKR